MRTVRSAIFALLLLGLDPSGFGQVAITSLRGTVFEESGAVVNDAAVTLNDPATGFSRTTKTNTQGEYQFPQIPPSTYDLSTSAPGFSTIRQTGIKLLVDTPGTLNVTLRVATGERQS